MQEFQKRVIAEKLELDDKINKLRAFLQGPVFDFLAQEDQDLLDEQFDLMKDYSDVLERRIVRFAV